MISRTLRTTRWICNRHRILMGTWNCRLPTTSLTCLRLARSWTCQTLLPSGLAALWSPTTFTSVTSCRKFTFLAVRSRTQAQNCCSKHWFPTRSCRLLTWTKTILATGVLTRSTNFSAPIHQSSVFPLLDAKPLHQGAKESCGSKYPESRFDDCHF